MTFILIAVSVILCLLVSYSLIWFVTIQFEDVALNCALWLLDKAELSCVARSSPIQVVRTISAMVSNTGISIDSIQYSSTDKIVREKRKGLEDLMGLRIHLYAVKFFSSLFVILNLH